MPAWPALLTTDLACAYTSLSEASFRFVAAQKKVLPVDCAGISVTRWRRADLDALIDSLPPRGLKIPPTEAGHANDSPRDPAEDALRRAERRARG